MVNHRTYRRDRVPAVEEIPSLSGFPGIAKRYAPVFIPIIYVYVETDQHGL